MVRAWIALLNHKTKAVLFIGILRVFSLCGCNAWTRIWTLSCAHPNKACRQEKNCGAVLGWYLCDKNF